MSFSGIGLGRLPVPTLIFLFEALHPFFWQFDIPNRRVEYKKMIKLIYTRHRLAGLLITPQE
jgi:hypothetical protein